jgi:hypothetical protein
MDAKEDIAIESNSKSVAKNLVFKLAESRFIARVLRNSKVGMRGKFKPQVASQYCHSTLNYNLKPV